MTAREFLQWQVFAAHEPVGLDRLDHLFAALGCALISPHLRKGARAQARWFAPDWWGRDREQSPEEQLALARRIAAAANSRKR